MKPHLYRELVNELRDVAKEYAHTQQLRERIAHTLGRYVTPDSPLEKFKSPPAPAFGKRSCSCCICNK